MRCRWCHEEIFEFVGSYGETRYMHTNTRWIRCRMQLAEPERGE